VSRHGYADAEDVSDLANQNLYRGTVTRAIAGRRGQALLLALREAMDAMTTKALVRV